MDEAAQDDQVLVEIFQIRMHSRWITGEKILYEVQRLADDHDPEDIEGRVARLPRAEVVAYEQACAAFAEAFHRFVDVPGVEE